MGRVIDFRLCRAVKTANEALTERLKRDDLIRFAKTGAPPVERPRWPNGIDDLEWW